MAALKHLPRPQKKRANNGSDNLRIVHDSKQSGSSLSRGRVHAQKFLKSTIYNKKMNYEEITLNLFTHKLNEIAGIVDEVVRAVVTDAPQIKRICFETGYGKPKKAIEIRKAASSYLRQRLHYTCDKSGSPKTFKFLSDRANRIVVFPQDYVDFTREQQEQLEAEQAVVAAKNSKKEAKERKRRVKHFVHNKWKKNLKYPEPKKKRVVLDDHDGGEGGKWFTPGGDEGDDNRQNVELLDMQIGAVESDENGQVDAREKDDGSSSAEVEETEETFLRNFTNLQVMLQKSDEHEPHGKNGKNKRFRNKNDVDIFEGVKNHSQKFEYEAPDAWRYKSKPVIPEHSEKRKKAKSDEWECEFCTFMNSNTDETCGMCFMEGFELRSRQFLSTVKENNQTNEQIENTPKPSGRNAEHDNRPKWTCATCTFVNTGEDDDACAMCGTVNEELEQYLDEKLDDFGSGFFQDKPPPPKIVPKTAEELRQEEDDELAKHFHTVKRVAAKPSHSKKNAKKSQKKTMAANQKHHSHLQSASSRNFPRTNNNNNNNNNSYDDGDLHFLSMSEAAVASTSTMDSSGLNAQIADINREFQATVWKAHQDKQARIAMIQRNSSTSATAHSMRPKQKQKQKQKSQPANVICTFQPHSPAPAPAHPPSQSQNGTPKSKYGFQPHPSHKTMANLNANGNAKKKNGGKQTNQSQSDASGSGTIKFEWIEKLTDMGFAYDKVMQALAATNSASYNQTLDYLIQNA